MRYTLPASKPKAGPARDVPQLVAARFAGIVNFAPVTLSLPERIPLVGVDLTTELEGLAFSVANGIASR